MLQDKYIGLILAMSSSVFIGLSFVITKKGLNSSRRRHGWYISYSKKEWLLILTFYRRISGRWKASLFKELDLVGWYRNK